MKQIHRLANFVGRRNAQARAEMGRVAVALSATHHKVSRIGRRIRVVGPNCSGKTFLAHCTASEAGVEVVRLSSVMCGMSGDVEAKFAEARAKGGPVLLLIDDGEMLTQPGMEMVLHELIEQVDHADNGRLVIVLNVTDDDGMDQALRSRFDQRVEVFHLEPDERRALQAA